MCGEAGFAVMIIEVDVAGIWAGGSLGLACMLAGQEMRGAHTGLARCVQGVVFHDSKATIPSQ